MNDRPTLRALVAIEVRPDVFTEPAFVSLELAAELAAKGYQVLVDPADERDLAYWEMIQRSVRSPKRRSWFD